MPITNTFFGDKAVLLGRCIAAALHAALCFYIFSNPPEGSGGGFIIFIIDLPVSFIPLLGLSYIDNKFGIGSALINYVTYGLIGSAWWFFLGGVAVDFAQRRAKLRTSGP
jgi:hypothetical protein